MNLTPLLIENFAGIFLSPRYDNPTPTAPFHRECWALYCSDAGLAAVVAPRNHAKSTALTNTFILAAALFRFEPHIMLIGSSERLAMDALGEIALELRDNEDLREEFGVTKFITDSKGEIVVACDDGYEFRVLARAVEQRVRGIRWHGRRPGLIVGDDIEEDEQVENPDRRRKLSRWINRALIPMGRKGCKVRIHGTIIHQDSFLSRAVHDPRSPWKHLFYKAHKSFDDFSEILWPQMFDAERLKEIRQTFISENDAGGYSQEYLNDPQDNEDAYLKPEWFLPMKEDDFDTDMLLGCGIDFAISKKDSANRSSMTVGGKTLSNHINIIDQRVGRWDSEEIVEEIFSIQDRWAPDFFWVEDGQIWLALWPMIRTEMLRRDSFINFIARKPIKDKASRGRPFQKRAKGGSIRWDKEASWYPPYEEELLRFTGITDARLDDQFDSTAILIAGFEDLADLEKEDFFGEEELSMERADPRRTRGQSQITGY